MEYRFTPSRDWSDFSSGRVLRSAPGQPAFPVRLANEVFQLCVEIREKTGGQGPFTVYDPCCGGAYLLTTVTLLNLARISGVIASDLDKQALQTASRNLSLLTIDGIERRIKELEADYANYGKDSHREALESAERIRSLLWNDPLQQARNLRLFQADATRLTAGDSAHIGLPDIVMADVPYGMQSSWRFPEGQMGAADVSPVDLLLDSLLQLHSRPVVAIAANKQTRIRHPQYQRLERFSAGKRRIELLMSRVNTVAQ